MAFRWSNLNSCVVSTLIFFASGCAVDNALVAKKSLTLLPINEDGFSSFVSSIKNCHVDYPELDLYVSVDEGYKGRYLELSVSGGPVFDFVEIPNSNDFAVSFYDSKGLGKEAIDCVNRAFAQNFYNIVVNADGGVNKEGLTTVLDEAETKPEDRETEDRDTHK